MHLKNSVLVVVQVLFVFSDFIKCQDSDFLYPTDPSSDKFEGARCTTGGGLNGICRKVADCSQTVTKLTRSDLCSFSGNSPIYCCAQDSTIPLDTKEADKFVNLRPADRICEHYYPSDKRDVQFFAGGTRSLAQQHPHMAAIGWTNGAGGVDWRCGGSLITLKFIITAAHCTSLSGVGPDIARTGDLNLLVTENNTYPEDFNITAIYAHPEYKDGEFYHDIALLKISPDHSYGNIIKPACLWTSPEILVRSLTGMGYGTTEFSGPVSNELFQGTLTLQTNEECSANVPPSLSIPSGIIRRQFCAQDPEHIKDTCQGDSGGPLQFYNTSGFRTRPVIAGITSFGQYCAGRSPGVYTRVSSYLDWLEPILMSDFEIPDPLR